MISRRGFFGAMAGAASILAMPILAYPRPPKLWGDGIHDDTEALQWYINHSSASNPVVFTDKKFVVSNTIFINQTANARFHYSTFIWRGDAGPVLQFPSVNLQEFNYA